MSSLICEKVASMVWYITHTSATSLTCDSDTFTALDLPPDLREPSRNHERLAPEKDIAKHVVRGATAWNSISEG